MSNVIIITWHFDTLVTFLQPHQNSLILHAFMDLFCSFVRVNLFSEKASLHLCISCLLFFRRWILCWFYCSCMHEIMQFALIIQCGCLIITRVYTAVIGTKKNDVANLQYVAFYGKKWPRLWFLPPVRLSILVRVVNLSGVCHKFWI